MPDQGPEVISTMARRPIDCPQKLLNGFINVVLLSGEVPLSNLKNGVPKAEMLFFAGTIKKIMGVTAVRYAQKSYHKYLFEQAGVPEMFNPAAVEVCWLSVNPQYRGRGIRRKLQTVSDEYLGNRPTFGVVRQANTVTETTDANQIGHAFKAPDKDHLITLIARNHDPVYDPEKKFHYGYEGN